MKILLTGATGFIGKDIIDLLLRDNHQIVILTRNVEKAKAKLPFPFEFYAWNPEKEIPPAASFQNIDGVIHLAGEGIAEKRWSSAQKEKIRSSRVLGTQNLVRGIEMHCNKPLQAFVSTSAIGYYGESQGEQPLDENSESGNGFLAEVCKSWEKAALACQNTKKTVLIRVGVVLGADGGALQKMLPIFKLGLGGPIGNGRQGFSWIHKHDLARIFVQALTDDKINGVVNGVAPKPVNNLVFTKALGRTLSRPTLFLVPPFALKFAMGEMSEIVLKNQFVIPKKLLTLGFVFQFSDIETALADVCHVKPLGRGKKKVRCELWIDQQWIDKPQNEVFAFFSEAKNLETITPPWLHFQVLQQSTPDIKAGTLIDYKLKIRGFPMNWKTLIENWNPPKEFSDSQIKGPYTIWHHTHDFKPYQNGTLMTDRVFYKIPLGFLGEIFALWFVKKDIRKIFRYRKKIIGDLFVKNL